MHIGECPREYATSAPRTRCRIPPLARALRSGSPPWTRRLRGTGRRGTGACGSPMGVGMGLPVGLGRERWDAGRQSCRHDSFPAVSEECGRGAGAQEEIDLWVQHADEAWAPVVCEHDCQRQDDAWRLRRRRSTDCWFRLLALTAGYDCCLGPQALTAASDRRHGPPALTAGSDCRL